MATGVTQRGSPIQTAFNNKYIISSLQLDQIVDLLTDKTFMTDIQLLFTNPADYITGVTWYPFKLDDFIGGTYAPVVLAGMPSTGITGMRLSHNFQMCKRVASFKIDRRFNNFMDFDPYTKVQIYLPFLGFYDLPINEIFNRYVYVYYALDLETAMGTAYIETNGRVIMTASGRIGIDLPLGSSNRNEMMKANIENAGKLVAGIIATTYGGNSTTAGSLLKAGGIKTAISAGIDTFIANQLRYNRGTDSGGSENIVSPNEVYLIITRPKPIDGGSIPSYINEMGLPVSKTKTLSECHGFTIIGSIHLENFESATDTEIKMIEDSLHKGVIL